MGGCCCNGTNDRSDENEYDIEASKRAKKKFGTGDAFGTTLQDNSLPVSASKQERDNIRYALESDAKRKFAPLRIAISLYVFLLIIIFIAGVLIGYYYQGALGDQVILLAFGYFIGGVLYVPYRSTSIGVTYTFVISRIITAVVGVLITLVYIGLRILFVVNCNDPSFLAEHPYESIVCTDSYGAVIGVIVFAGLEVVIFIVFIIIDAQLVRPAKKLKDFIEKRKKFKPV